MFKKFLVIALLAGSFSLSAQSADPGTIFSSDFSVGASLKHKNLPSCDWEKPFSMRTKRLCADAGAGTGLYISNNVSSLKQFPAYSLANPSIHHTYLWVDSNSIIQGVQIWTESSGHNYMLSYLIKNYGEPERSKEVIGSFLGSEFDKTGKPVSSEYKWNKGDYRLIYRPYQSSRDYRMGTVILENDIGKKLREEFAPDSREKQAERAAQQKPQSKKICLDGICIGDSPDSLPAGLKWEFARPEDYRDLLVPLKEAKAEWEKSAAQAKKEGWERPDDFMVRNAQGDIDNAVKELKRIYPSGDTSAIQELARRFSSSSGEFEGNYLKLSDIPLLKKLKFACDEKVWAFRYVTKSGYPTEVLVGYGVEDEKNGSQKLRVDAIIRKYPEIRSETELFNHVTALEKAVGAEISFGNKQTLAEYPVQLSYSFDRLQINSRNYIRYFQRDHLAKHPGCSKRVSVE